MKITSIHLKNLNSLRGEWKIDFTAGSYESDGIFAITGPMGAGKTTIFDAICLALYGQTPRLGKITIQSNEIMTKHTNECFAEVIFDAGGKKYLCSWGQHRAKKGGKLQPVKHILSEYPGKILTENTSSTVEAVQNIIGMDFKRFGQTVMLEQGRFDEFLKANAGDRSTILELLTGTEIYGQISHDVYERTEREKKELDDIRIQLDKLKPRDDYGTDEEIEQELDVKREEISELEAEHEDIRAGIEWLRGIASIQDNITRHDGQLEQVNRQIDLFTVDARRLDAALRANDVCASHAFLVGKRNQFAMLQDRHERLKRDTARDEESIMEIETMRLPELEFDYKRRLQNIPEGETPESLCARAEGLLKIYADNRTKTYGLADRKVKAEQELMTARTMLERSEKEYREALARHEEIFRLRMRAALNEDEPCPVCGATVHPAVMHAQGNPEVIENIPDFEAVSRRLQEAQRREGIARTNLEHRVEEVNENAEAVIQSKSAVLEVITPMGICGLKTVESIEEALRQWLSDIRHLCEQIQNLTNRAEKLRAGLENMKKTFQEDSKSLIIMTRELETAESDFAEKLSAKGFANEEEFIASCLDDDTVRKLNDKKNYLDGEIKKVEALISNYREKLNAEQAKNITTQTLEELSPAFKEKDTRIKLMQKNIYALETALQIRKNIHDELDELNKRLAEQNQKYSDWSALCDLIGQKNGGKFRQFAQRITLQMMIGLANKNLAKLNERYTLTTETGEGGLKLWVIDHEQAEAVRPTENLSGGERFIISLALALGLSQISGSKAQVDSLFLDEGFGSLDDDSLNTALEALGEFRREGRMIGIISHVQALKDRITAQINIIPKREGVSIIEEPGCSRG